MVTPIIIITAVCGFAITAVLGRLLIPVLRRLKFGQTIREDGPKWHAAKQGTPTMGGIMLIGGVVLSCIIGYVCFIDKIYMSKETIRLFAGLLMATCFGMVGFLDDYIKVVKKQNLGLRAKQKLVLQALITVLYLLTLYLFGDTSTTVNVPFIGQWDLGVLYYLIMGVLIIGIVNSANLTDGIDGLLGSTTFVVAAFFMIVTGVLHAFEANILATALTSSLLGFLLYNIHPAKVFMGDTGSFFLGGLVVALAFSINMPLILFFVGFIYCVESLSVILQVISFKTTGKRIFKMSPIHHHFEMSGWSENKIVVVFCSITAVMCAIAFAAITAM